MKKLMALAMSAVMVLSMAACTSTVETTESSVDYAAKSEGVMTHLEYDSAALDSQVVIEAYVQDKQTWWDDKATVYLADPDGAYFAYNMACSEADYALLVPGQKIKITGYKSEWSGEVEIIDSTFEIEDGNWIADYTDLTALFESNSEELIAHQNEKFEVTGVTVASEPIFNWDGSGVEGDDIYFDVQIGDQTYTMTIESYLTGSGSSTYEVAKTLQVGDEVTLGGFLYWYEGPNPHITLIRGK